MSAASPETSRWQGCVPVLAISMPTMAGRPRRTPARRAPRRPGCRCRRRSTALRVEGRRRRQRWLGRRRAAQRQPGQAPARWESPVRRRSGGLRCDGLARARRSGCGGRRLRSPALTRDPSRGRRLRGRGGGTLARRARTRRRGRGRRRRRVTSRTRPARPSWWAPRRMLRRPRRASGRPTVDDRLVRNKTMPTSTTTASATTSRPPKPVHPWRQRADRVHHRRDGSLAPAPFPGATPKEAVRDGDRRDARAQPHCGRITTPPGSVRRR